MHVSTAISSSFHDPDFYSLSISVIVKASSGPKYVVSFITDSILMSKQGSDVSTNHLSELAPVNKEKSRKIKGFRKSSEVAFVILAPKVFKILEKLVHEFHGHGGEILSLSWSRKGLADLWPKGSMNNHGIRNAICRAKERRRTLFGMKRSLLQGWIAISMKKLT
ncbi:unnamed protein product [Lactuca saligna]|uniref:Uncharacterized protein n=1 Tax=Lactuca saligna TaxID=75948 RepID=A0AA35V8Z9_LACSI|nr:unnamed protein product [Lactuca saligna]